MKLAIQSLLALGIALAGSGSFAHTDKPHASKAGAVKKEQKAWGIAGDAAAVTRTIEIRMTDKMRFTPELIQGRQGETIRPTHVNAGKLMHEFVLGTRKELDEHAAS